MKQNILLRKAKIFEKGIDKQQDLWYTLGTVKERIDTMKIKRNAGKEEEFCRLWFGTVFLVGNVLYMKTSSITTNDEREFNAVVLETGEFIWFGNEALVHPCYDAELLIP